MEFFVSWYPGDAHYPLYDNNCALLVSITSVAQNWTIRALPKLPRRLLIDSGGYHLISTSQVPSQLIAADYIGDTAKLGYDGPVSQMELDEKLLNLSPKKVLDRQLSLLGGKRIPTIVCALDYPILNASLSWREKDKCIAQTIASAYELKRLIAERGVSQYVTPLAIIQGYDIDSIKYCAQELVSIGFPLYGLGSLAPLKQHDLIMERVSAVVPIVEAHNLHVFGVSVIQTAGTLRSMGIHSIDSARPAKSAAYNEILYSDPFRRFGILEPSLADLPLKGRIPRERRLSSPLSCSCPICTTAPERIMGVGKRASIRDRGVHNYYHLKRIICGLEQEQV